MARFQCRLLLERSMFGLNELLGATRGTQLVLMLGQAICNCIVVALLSDEYMHLQVCASRSIKRAHSNSSLVARQRVPEKTGAALRTEPAPSPLRRCVPPQALLTRYGERVSRYVGRGKIMTRLFATLDAVTGVRWA